MRILYVLPFVLALALPAQPQPLLVRGRTVAPDGTPIAGAGVLFGPAQRVSAQQALASSQRSGANGGFTLRIDARGRFLPGMLLIAAPERTTMRVENLFFRVLRDPTASTVELGTIVLAAGTAIEGRVRDARSRPIAGARVRAEDLLSPGPFAACTPTTQALGDAKGRFVLVGACRSAMRIVVDAPGYFRKTIPFANARDPMVFILEPSGFVEGRVVGAKELPVLVRLMYELVKESEFTMTDAEGRFRLTKRFPCRCAVVAGRVFRAYQVARSPWLAEPKAGVEIRIPAGTLEVRAEDAETGSPIKAFRGAVQWRTNQPEDPFRRMFSYFAREADADGVLRLAPPVEAGSGRGLLRVVAEGYVPYMHRRAPRPKPDGTSEAVVELERGAAALGRILDAATGKPIAAAHVVCFEKPEGGGADLRHARGDVRTDGEGRFRIRGLAKGSFTLVARRAGSRVEAVHTFAVDADDKDVEKIGILLGAQLAIQGKVRNREALPRGARMVATPREKSALPNARFHGGSPASVRSSVPIDEKGEFRVADCGPGLFDLYLVLPSAPRTGVPLRVPAGTVAIAKNDASVEVDAAKVRAATVTGKVVVTGAHVPEGRLVVVFATSSGVPGADFEYHLGGSRWVVPERDGHFRVEVAPGRCRVFLVDLATGVRVHVLDRELMAVAGAQLRADVAARIVEVVVTLRPSGDTMAVDQIEVTLLRWGMGYLLGVGPLGTNASGGARGLRLLVPEGPVKLKARPGYLRGDGVSMNFPTEILGETEFDAVPGKRPLRVELEVSRRRPVRKDSRR